MKDEGLRMKVFHGFRFLDSAHPKISGGLLVRIPVNSCGSAQLNPKWNGLWDHLQSRRGLRMNGPLPVRAWYLRCSPCLWREYLVSKPATKPQLLAQGKS